MNEALYVMGNGEICAYGYRGNIDQVFGAPYSAPSMGAFLLDLPEGYDIVSRRTPGSAIWNHTIHCGSRQVASITEFADAELCCFVRSIETTAALDIRYFPSKDSVKIRENTAYFPQATFALSLLFQRESHIYCEHVTGREIPDQLVCTGKVRAERIDGGYGLHITGECRLYLTSGDHYAACIETTETALQTPFHEMYRRTLHDWEQFRQIRMPAEQSIQSAELLQAIDDVSVLIRAQQAKDGGILAGHQYHLAYVRDMLGVSMFLLEVGYTEEARKILEFYHQIFQTYGHIKNAQAMGIPGVFHIHENDCVEITGYLLIQAFRYLQKSGDAGFIQTIAPMLRWAFEAQEHELADDMLPFNGDETYIAGYMLPRYTLFDGSAEATMLFILGGELALAGEWLYHGEERAQKLALIRRVKGAYHSHFCHNGHMVANQPSRLNPVQYPRFKYGICEHCTAHTWLEQNPGHRYLCPDCFETVPLPERDTSCFEIPAVTLSPLFAGSDLFSDVELRQMTSAMIRTYNETGVMPSQASGAGQVGYEFGLLLNALAVLNLPEGETLYRDTLNLQDETGAWAEYYINGQPHNTRCRPWESAINLYGCIRYSQMNDKENKL